MLGVTQNPTSQSIKFKKNKCKASSISLMLFISPPLAPPPWTSRPALVSILALPPNSPWYDRGMSKGHVQAQLSLKLVQLDTGCVQRACPVPTWGVSNAGQELSRQGAPWPTGTVFCVSEADREGPLAQLSAGLGEALPEDLALGFCRGDQKQECPP